MSSFPGVDPAVEVLKIAEVASVLRVSKRVVYELVASGRLPSLRISGRTIRVPTAALMRFIEGPGAGE